MFINYQTERYLVADLNLSTPSFAYFENVDRGPVDMRFVAYKY